MHSWMWVQEFLILSLSQFWLSGLRRCLCLFPGGNKKKSSLISATQKKRAHQRSLRPPLKHQELNPNRRRLKATFPCIQYQLRVKGRTSSRDQWQT